MLQQSNWDEQTIDLGLQFLGQDQKKPKSQKGKKADEVMNNGS